MFPSPLPPLGALGARKSRRRRDVPVARAVPVASAPAIPVGCAPAIPVHRTPRASEYLSLALCSAGRESFSLRAAVAARRWPPPLATAAAAAATAANAAPAAAAATTVVAAAAAGFVDHRERPARGPARVRAHHDAQCARGVRIMHDVVDENGLPILGTIKIAPRGPRGVLPGHGRGVGGLGVRRGGRARTVRPRVCCGWARRARRKRTTKWTTCSTYYHRIEALGPGQMRIFEK